MVKIAATGDLHVRVDNVSTFRSLFEDVCVQADILVLCGDLTNRGLPDEAEVLADELLTRCRLPMVAVLGNHDIESGHQVEVSRILRQAGVKILDDEPHEVHDVGFAGGKGFCGGFDAHALSPFGEQSIKDFVRETVDASLQLETGLAKLRTRHKVAVLHYAPIRETVVGEPPEIFPFLGSSRLAEPIDRYHATAAFHGHAHRGSLEGRTVGGTPVYNVAYGLMQSRDADRPYLVLELDGS